nr:MAG TPA: hypothetical protein [Caudoviricetes sp.]
MHSYCVFNNSYLIALCSYFKYFHSYSRKRAFWRSYFFPSAFLFLGVKIGTFLFC